MLGKRLINTGSVACTTDTVQILDPGSTQSVALYRFEDNANDTSNSTGKFSKGAVFNGSSSYITTPSVIPTNNFSFSFWINMSSFPGSSSNQQIFTQNENNNRWYIAVYESGRIQAWNGSSTFTTSSSVINLNQWYNVVYTASSSSGKKIYVDGTEVLSDADTNNNTGTASGNLFIGFGKWYANSLYLNGKLDQVRIFNKSLSSSEVTQLKNETTSTVNTLQVLGDTSCVAAYAFEGNANDLSTNYNGTASNIIYDYSGTASNAAYVTGKFGKAFDFSANTTTYSGTSSFISFANDMSRQNDYSWSFWIKSTGTISNYATIISFYGSYYNYIYFNPGISNIYMELGDGGATSFNTGMTSGSNWYHLVLTKSSSTGRAFYVNGSSVFSDSNTTNGSAPSRTGNAIGMHWGSGSAWQYPLNGDTKIDQFRIFDKALSLAEINSLYNETATSAASATIDNPSTVAYYKMADASDETGSYDGTAYGIDFNVQGKFGFAGKFSGSSGSYIQTGYTALPGTSASISLWVNINAYTSYGGFAIDSTGTGAQARFTLGQGNAAGKLWVSVGNGSTSWYDETTVSISSYGLNNWFHLVGTVNGTSVKIYINGSLIHTFTSSVSYIGGGQHTYYLGGWGNSLHLNGKLDQIRFFNKAISASEVTTLYNEKQCDPLITTPESYFNTVTYQTDGSYDNITGVGFKPDLVWIKRRDSGGNHYVFDSVRGVHKAVFPDETYDEADNGNYLTAFETNGFALGSAAAGANSALVGNNNTYVAWNWKAGGDAVSNSDGTITTQVSANTVAGFSMVLAPTQTDVLQEYGHGLGDVPELILMKTLDSTQNWLVYHKDVGTGRFLNLNTNGAASTAGSYPDMFKSVTSQIIETKFFAANTRLIFYCFKSIDSYQKIGTYLGNGSANGPFVYTGFEPAFVLIKRTDSARNWRIIDNKRSTTNPRDKEIYPNLNNQDGTYDSLNFHTNGFQVINTDISYNASNGSYLFWAIAANPDTTAPTKANSFNIKSYTGDDNNNRSITGLGLKPDFLWIKRRASASESHAIYDSVRGPNLQLSSDTAGAEATNSGSYLGMSSFDDDGFNVGNNGGTNRAPHDYVAWAWKGLDHDKNLATINYDGGITSVVSANPAAGFSIVKYTGNNTSGATIGHGLSQRPDIIFVKGLDNARTWMVKEFTTMTSDNNYLALSGSDEVKTSGSSTFIKSTSNSNVIVLGNSERVNFAEDYIAYCWYSVPGHSKIGTYQGDSNSGNSVNVGFTPTLVVIKGVDSASNWIVHSAVVGMNGADHLRWNTSAGEDSGANEAISFTNTGFSITTSGATQINTNGEDYIYMAFK